MVKIKVSIKTLHYGHKVDEYEISLEKDSDCIYRICLKVFFKENIINNSTIGRVINIPSNCGAILLDGIGDILYSAMNYMDREELKVFVIELAKLIKQRFAKNIVVFTGSNRGTLSSMKEYFFKYIEESQYNYSETKYANMNSYNRQVIGSFNIDALINVK